MGNCVKPVDPLIASLPRDSETDASPIKQSGLPIIFFIGGPGSGKKTQCNKVAQKYHFLSIVSGEILRNEVQRRSPKGFVLARLMSQGRLIPGDVLVELIKTKMLNNLDSVSGFFLTGFPRENEQGKLFERQVKPVDLVLYLSVSNSVLTERIMARSATSTERYKFNYDSIKARTKACRKANNSIVRYYKKKLVVIDGEDDIPTVFENICKAIDTRLKTLTHPTSSFVHRNEVTTAERNT